jgi:isopentenyl-diphosphate delta-isomerase
MEDQLILVNEEDRQVGVGAKLEVHEKGLLHRAFSIFLWDREGRLLIQRRARTKYHAAGLWANTCCGHPRPDEDTAAAAHRRLNEEFGMTAELEWDGSHIYRAVMPNALIEAEVVHLYSGFARDLPNPNAEEIDAYRWLSSAEIVAESKLWPDSFAPWFALYLNEIPDRIFKHRIAC